MKFFYIFFISTVTAITIECEYKDKDYSPETIYTCEVKNIEYDGESNLITNHTGIHPDGGSYSDFTVKIVEFTSSFCYESNLTFIPKGFSSQFPNLIAFHYNNCPFNESLIGDELNEYSALENFTLTNTNLEKIPGNFFTNLSNLTYIDLSNNKIKEVGGGLLRNLSNLQVVNFANNECINQTATNRDEIMELENALLSCMDETLNSSSEPPIVTDSSIPPTVNDPSTPPIETPTTTPSKSTKNVWNFILFFFAFCLSLKN